MNPPRRQPPSLASVAARGQDKELSIKDLINALRDVTNWERLGQELGVRQAKLQEIAMARGYRNPHSLKTDMLTCWMRNDCGASWEKLATALDEMGHSKAAGKERFNLLLGSGV